MSNESTAAAPVSKVTAADLLPELALPPAAAPATPPPAPTSAPAPAPASTETAPTVAPGTLDRKGTPYDPARHIPKMKAKTGAWMPRGGRKPAPRPGEIAAAPTPAPAPSPKPGETFGEAYAFPPRPPIPEIGPDEPAPAPASAAGEKPAGDTAANKAPEPARPSQDFSLPHETAAELASRATYAVTGVVIGDHKKATATGAEHETLKKGYASFFAHRNLVLVGGFALLAVVVAYLLGEARREEVVGTVKKMFTKKPAPRPVVEIAPAPPASPPPTPPEGVRRAPVEM